MAVTYTVDIRDNISNPLRALMWAEFKPVDVVFGKDFDPARMSRGEYIRYYLLESTKVEGHSDGETRDYEIEIVYYFDTKYYRTKKAFDDIYSDRFERLKRTLEDNEAYNDGTYRWHSMVINTDPVQTVEELEEVEEEQTIAQRFSVTIRRSNFR